MAGELGWLVTAWMVAVQFAAAAAASSTRRGGRPGEIAGQPPRLDDGGEERNASSTSGCTATAAPASHADRLVLDSASARTAYSSSPVATASSGWPHRMVTLHRAVAPAAASQKRLGRVAPRRSAIASAANRATAEMATW